MLQKDDTGKTHYPFGRGFVADGDGADLTKGVQVVRLPISIAANDANETGVPLTLQRPSNATVELDAYRELANAVSKELLLLQYGSPEGKDNKQLVVFDLDPDHEFDVSTVTLSLDKSKAGSEKLLVRLLSDSTAIQLTLLPSHLRSRNPKTGDLLSESPFLNLDGSGDEDTQDAVVTKTRKRSPSIIPTKVERRGRYGFAVEWGDGATVIYSMLSLARAAGGIVRQ